MSGKWGQLLSAREQFHFISPSLSRCGRFDNIGNRQWFVYDQGWYQWTWCTKCVPFSGWREPQGIVCWVWYCEVQSVWHASGTGTPSKTRNCQKLGCNGAGELWTYISWLFIMYDFCCKVWKYTFKKLSVSPEDHPFCFLRFLSIQNPTGRKWYILCLKPSVLQQCI